MCKNNCLKCIVPVSVTTASGINAVPYTDRLNKEPITHVWIRTANGVQKDIKGATLAPIGVIKTAHLKLVNGEGTTKMDVPLEWLQRDTNSPDPICVEGLDIDSSQCSIILDTTASGYSATHVIELIWGIQCPGKNCQ